MNDALTYALDGRVAVVILDDGRLNVFSSTVVEGLHTALDKAAADGACALVLSGRERVFSAGYDLSVMVGADDTSILDLHVRGAELLLRLYSYDVPTVVAAGGHALGFGSLLLLAADHRIGAEDLPAKIGLNAVAIGVALPGYAIELARDRLAQRELPRATMAANVYDLPGAVQAGFLDRLAPSDTLLHEAMAEAQRLAQTDPEVYAQTKRALRRFTRDRIVDWIDNPTGFMDRRLR